MQLPLLPSRGGLPRPGHHAETLRLFLGRHAGQPWHVISGQCQLMLTWTWDSTLTTSQTIRPAITA
jgi:hypothetical protein